MQRTAHAASYRTRRRAISSLKNLPTTADNSIVSDMTLVQFDTKPPSPVKRFSCYTMYALCHTLWCHASIEPILWFCMTGFAMTSIVEQSFYNYKTCRADFHLDRQTCLAFWNNQNTSLTKAIQVTTSHSSIRVHAIHNDTQGRLFY